MTRFPVALLLLIFSHVLQAQKQDSVALTQAVKKDTVTIIGVGDIMMGSNHPDNAGLPPNDGQLLLKEVEDVLKNADVTMGNLEGVLLDSGGMPKTCRDPKV